MYLLIYFFHLSNRVRKVDFQRVLICKVLSNVSTKSLNKYIEGTIATYRCNLIISNIFKSKCRALLYSLAIALIRFFIIVFVLIVPDYYY
jgi:hypothetical protein